MNTHSIAAGNLGYPRIGLHRELNFALERFWSGEWSSQELEAATRELRVARWRIQAEAGIVHIPSNDFSLYDHVLDAAVLVGAIPARYGPPFRRLGPAHVFRHGARKQVRSSDGDDQGVRHEFPLHRPRVRAGNGVSSRQPQTSRGVPRSKGARAHNASGATRPGLAGAVGQSSRSAMGSGNYRASAGWRVPAIAD